MAKPKKIYWSKDRKIRIDVFENKSKSKKGYNIFKIFFYVYSRPFPVCLNRFQLHSLKEVLDKIKIRGKDQE